MDPLFTEEQLNKMSREDIISLMKTMQEHYQKQETKIQILEEKTKELEFLNAMLSDRLTLAQRKQFGPSSEKYADGYTQLNLFNEAEQEAEPDAPEPEMEEIHPSSYKRKKRSGKKEEDLSAFETTEVIEYKLTGADRNCPDCNTKYKVVTKETVKRLKFVPARFEVVEEVTYVYSCPKCGAMKRPEKAPSLLKGSVATPSLVAGIMNAKYVGGMPLARQEREFARYDLNLSTKTMANWIIQCADRYLQPLYELMKEEFLRSRYAHGDETRVQVIDEPEQKGSTQNWMWVYLTDEYSGSPRMVLFQYERTRAGYHPVEFPVPGIFHLRWIPGIPQPAGKDHRDRMHGPCEAHRLYRKPAAPAKAGQFAVQTSHPAILPRPCVHSPPFDNRGYRTAGLKSIPQSTKQTAAF